MPPLKITGWNLKTTPLEKGQKFDRHDEFSWGSSRQFSRVDNPQNNLLAPTQPWEHPPAFRATIFFSKTITRIVNLARGAYGLIAVLRVTVPWQEIFGSPWSSDQWIPQHMGVSKNNCTPKSSILIGFSIINHPFWGTPIFGNIHIPFQSISNIISWQFFVTFLGWLSDLLERLSDLQLGDEKVTLNHLAWIHWKCAVLHIFEN